jgi:ribonuclease HII
MKRAVIQAIAACPQRPSAILVDAMPLKLLFSGYQDIQVHHFPKAESKSSSVAAASIIAKVKRDALMKRLDVSFPGYHLGAHKGYATDTHCSAIRAQGASIIHRVSFLDKILAEQATQLSLMSIENSETSR